MLAAELRMSRSELYALAIRELMDRRDRTTERLNKMVASLGDAAGLDEALEALQNEAIEHEQWC